MASAEATVVETNIHYPTDSSLLGDGVRVLTRTTQFTVDCATREVWVQRIGLASHVDAEGKPVPATLIEQLNVPVRDPLAQEQEHFFHAIRTGEAPITSAEMGVQAVRLAEMIQARADGVAVQT